MSLHLSLLGSPNVARVAEQTSIPLAARDAVLLTWLILVGPTTRAQLAALLWPDSSEEQARNSLRQRLFQLRRQVGADLVAGSATLELAPDVTHDLDGPTALLLGDMVLPECPALYAWLQVMRESRARRQRTALIEQFDALEAQSDWRAALPLAEALVKIEPLSEHAHRRVMRLHYLLDDRAAALQAFDRLERRLKDDVGMRPDAASLALLHTIERSKPLDVGHAKPLRPVPPSLMHPPSLVGRESELARVQQILDQGQVVALVGEAGIGKTRLVQAIVQGRSDVVLWSGRADDVITPYATVARGLGALLRSMPPDLAQRLTRDLQDDLARVMPEMFATDTPLRSSRASPSRAVRQILKAAWPRGATIVIDDLHVVDEASAELVRQCLADEARPLWRVIVALRPTPWLNALVELGELVPVVLPSLSEDALVRLIDSLDVPGLTGHDLAPALHQHTGGNPRFALETLKLAWSESPSIDPKRLPRPDTVMKLIGHHVAQLSEPALALARVAALAGVDFSLELAEAVLERHAVALSDAWRELESHEVMRSEGFAHDLIAEAVREGVPDAIGRAMHARIARWLESHGGEPARVARHHERSGRGDLAVPGLRAAADRAHLALREPERIEFLLHAADIARDQGQRAVEYDCLREAIEAHITSMCDDSRQLLLDRLDALTVTPRERAQAAALRAHDQGSLGHWTEAVAHGERALVEALASGDEAVQVMARQRLGTAYAMTGACEPALATLLSIRDWMQSQARVSERREYFGNLAVVMDNAGRLDEARLVHETSIAEVEHTDEHAQHVTVLGNLAMNRLNAGDVAGARERLAVAQRIVHSHDLPGARRAVIALLQARCARLVGRYGEALERFEKARAGHGSAPVLAAMVHLHEALCWLDLNLFDRAAQALQDPLRQDMPARCRGLALLVKAQLARLQQQPSDTFVEEAARTAPRGGWFDLHFAARLWMSTSEPSARALDALDAIVTESRAMGFHGMAFAARLRACDLAASAYPARGKRLARQALLAGSHVEAEAFARADRWLQPARALEAAGELEEAADVARMGAAWVHQASQQVPERWRDSFLIRSGPAGQLLAMVDRLG